MAEIEKKTRRYPTDLTDEEWSRIQPFLPGGANTGRPIEVDLREVLNAIAPQFTDCQDNSSSHDWFQRRRRGITGDGTLRHPSNGCEKTTRQPIWWLGLTGFWHNRLLADLRKLLDEHARPTR